MEEHHLGARQTQGQALHQPCAWASYSRLPQLTHVQPIGLSEGMEVLPWLSGRA